MSSFHLMTDSLPFFNLYCSSLYRSTSTASLIYFYPQSLSSSFLHILIALSILSWFCLYLTVSNSCSTAWSQTEIWLAVWGQIGLNKLLFKSFHGQIFKVNQIKMATINLQHLSAMFKLALFNWVWSNNPRNLASSICLDNVSTFSLQSIMEHWTLALNFGWSSISPKSFTLHQMFSITEVLACQFI